MLIFSKVKDLEQQLVPKLLANWSGRQVLLAMLSLLVAPEASIDETHGTKGRCEEVHTTTATTSDE